MNDLDPTGSLRLDLLDSGGNRLDDKVDIKMKHLEISYAPDFFKLDASKPIRISKLKATQPGLYLITIMPTRYHVVGGFVRISEDKETLASFQFPIHSANAKPEFPSYDQLDGDLKAVLGRIDPGTNGPVKKDCEKPDSGDYGSAKGSDLYGMLDDKSRASLLNVFAKMKSTVFENGRNTFSYVSYFTCFQGDRFYAVVDPELRTVTDADSSMVPHEKAFHPDTDVAHTPIEGFLSNGSVKSWDHYGNLQLTFSNNPTTGRMMIDADIDDAQWVEHGFQVLEHHFTGDRTDPYRIHEVLSIGQGIDPLYKLTVA